MKHIKGLMQFSLAFVGLMLISLSANALDIPGPLVETEWLEANLSNVVLLDVRKKFKEDTQRISGATIVPWKKVRAKRKVDGIELIKMLPEKSDFENLMQSVGVNSDSTIVITSESIDSDTTFFGTRLYWQLKYFGHEKIALLHGGNVKWFKEKRASSDKNPDSSKGNFKASKENKAILATTEDVEKAVGDKGTVLIDARSEDMYLGLFNKSYVSGAGHISGAKSADGYTFLKHGKVKTFHKPEEIKTALLAKGIDPDANTIVYCNSGHLGSGIWFIEHELLGNKKAALYDGSMHEWTKDSNRTVISMKVE